MLVRDIRVRAIGPVAFTPYPHHFHPAAAPSSETYLRSPPYHPLLASSPPSLIALSSLSSSIGAGAGCLFPPTTPPVHLTFRSRRTSWPRQPRRGPLGYSPIGERNWTFRKETLSFQPLTASVRARNEPASPNSSGAGKGDPEDLELLAALRGFPVRVFDLRLP